MQHRPASAPGAPRLGAAAADGPLFAAEAHCTVIDVPMSASRCRSIPLVCCLHWVTLSRLALQIHRNEEARRNPSESHQTAGPQRLRRASSVLRKRAGPSPGPAAAWKRVSRCGASHRTVPPVALCSSRPPVSYNHIYVHKTVFVFSVQAVALSPLGTAFSSTLC